MSASLLDRLHGDRRPVIGMLHLGPLPGAPRSNEPLARVRTAMLRDARTLLEGGARALLLENLGDAPYFPRRVPAATVAQMTALGLAVRSSFPEVPLGINVLRNDGLSALAVAHAIDACFIRVNVLAGARVTDQGIVEGPAHELARARRALGAESVAVLADVDVKHSAPLGTGRPIEQEAAELVMRAGADAVIVSGAGSGEAVSIDHLERVRGVLGGRPLVVGSGVTVARAARLRQLADGFIVGTAVKRGGRIEAPVSLARVRRLVAALQ